MSANSLREFTASGQVDTGAKTVRSIIVTPGTGATTVIKFHDSTTNNASRLTVQAPVGGISVSLAFHGARFQNGLYIEFVAGTAPLVSVEFV